MGPAEVGHRAVHQVRQRAWRSRQVRPGDVDPLPIPSFVPPFRNLLPLAPAPIVPDERALDALVAVADGLIEGRWTVLGVHRTDLDEPDWFLDPVTGRRAAPDTYAFSVDYRTAERTGIVKNIWEPSRHHQLTVLAAAYHHTGRSDYAEMVARQLRSWWRVNPFLSGVHWTSGIELGVRLVSWAWIRRLLDGWPGVAELFEHDPEFLRQVQHHQEYLAAFSSTGSSANNHLIAEAAGLAVAGLAFPWFASSAAWADEGMAVLLRELDLQTDADGINRELASEYHGLVLELALAVAAEQVLAGRDVPEPLIAVIVRMTDALAAVVDVHLEPPRQGDGDDGYGLLLDDPARNRWGSLLAVGAGTFGARAWWPAVPALDVGAALLATALRGHLTAGADRPTRRTAVFASSGMTILRTEVTGSELWCRLDAGPHGYLSIAAHGHADALSVELRHDGVEVLADPGTYCYHGDDAARAYFRSTLGHNTLELGGTDQSSSGGPFLWTRHAASRLVSVVGADDDGLAVWVGEHDGYASLRPPAHHRRTVVLDRGSGRLEVVDRVDVTAAVAARLAWHLGPDVSCSLEAEGGGQVARLAWTTSRGPIRATMHLPPSLRWSTHDGQVAPMLGWYSPSFGVRRPAITLLGEGPLAPGSELRSILLLGQAA